MIRTKQPLWAVFWLGSVKGVRPMIVIPMTWFELAMLILTALLVYIAWRNLGNTKK